MKGEGPARPSRGNPNAVAIIGIAGRFPGAGSVEEFWNNLCAGTESISRFSQDELEDWFSDEVRHAPNYVKARPILPDVEQFDAGFFGMHRREAELTDPQHRLFLECAWEALEDAGCDPAAYAGAIGVFAGSSMNTYLLNNIGADRNTIEEFTSSYQVGSYPLLLGSAQDFLATRVSYKFDLKGPALTLQTACSTSLVAVIQACQSLLLYQSDMALAGGVSITFPQKRGYQHQEGGMVSADGSCRTFDAKASGTVFGSGAGVVLLKRLDEALADRDHIYAVIRGCGINNDGASKVGFTAPSIEGQAAAIEMALAAAEVEARSISYVECHGTATPLGDPIEIAALTRAFRASTAERQFCAVASVKTNIGHLDVAAGVVGLIKTALSLKHRLLPPSLHFERPNPRIDFAASPFYVNSQLADWQAGDGPRRAGVSAFGVGGTNAHVILEEAPPMAVTEAGAAPTPGALLVVSARSAVALDRARIRLSNHMRLHPEVDLDDVCHSLQTGRRAFKHRSCIPFRNPGEALAGLEGTVPQRQINGIAADAAPTLSFMFPGQGAQYPQMGRGLYAQEPEFRQKIDRCAEILKPLINVDLRELLYPDRDSPEAADLLAETAFAQPAMFAVEYALTGLWASRGVRPAAMIGHSVGELVAAAVAGVFSLDDALSLIALRGQLMQSLPAGGMLAVRLAEVEIASLLPATLALAAVNGPALCVVAGPNSALADFERSLQARQVPCRRLHTSHAFHSPMIEPILEPLRHRIERMELSAPSLPWVSCVSGTWITPEQATSAEYWARHARETVRFADGIASLMSAGSGILLEVGPGNTLATLAAQSARERQFRICGSLPDAARELADSDHFSRTLGRLWVEGVPIQWPAPFGRQPRRVPLPTYPFERSRHWIEQPQRHARNPAGLVSFSGNEADVSQHAVPVTIASTQQENTMLNMAPAAAASGVGDQLPQHRATVIALLEDLSGERLSGADPSMSFLEMGFDSLFLSQLAQRLQSQFKIKISFRQLLGEFPSIQALAGLLADKLPANSAAVAPVPFRNTVDSASSALKAASAGTLSLAAPGTIAHSLEALLRDQLQTMSQLFNRQFEAIQAMGGQAAATAPPTVAASAAPPPEVPVPAPSQEPLPSRFQAYGGSHKDADTQLTSEQRSHIDLLTARYTAKTRGSKLATQTYRPVLADPRAAAAFRAEWKELVYPIICARAAGSRIWDVDGNEYIDLVNGYGQTAFGHSPAFVIDALKRQLDLGFAIGPQAELAGKVATLFAELTGNERVTFCNTGSEAVMAALRVARSVTGRNQVVVFNGAYHGQFDEVLVKGMKRADGSPRSAPVATGIPDSAVQNLVVLDYGTPSALDWIRQHAESLAAVVVETVQSRRPGFLPLEFLRELRRITETSGTALVMDEVVTGFRVHPGGMQAVTGIRADLATYGKVVGGGLPIGVLAGKASFMDALDGGPWGYGDDSIPSVGVTFFAGTFVRHPLALAAAWAVLNHVKDQGPALQQRLSVRTAALVKSLNGVLQRHGLKIQLESYASFFYFNPHSEHGLAGLLFHHLRDRGIHIQDGFPCFLTTEHSDSDMQCIVSAFDDSLTELRGAGIFGPAVPSNAPQGLTGLTPTESQIEIWLAAQQSDEASCAFNESVTLRLQGPLDREAFQSALDQLVSRHEALRISFASTGETFMIAPQAEFRFPTTDLTGLPPRKAVAAFAALVNQDARTAFNLVDGPLFRGQLVQLAQEQHQFLFTTHHIVCDGWSINLLLRELGELYSAACRGTIPALTKPLSFGDYALGRFGDPAEVRRDEAYWLAQFAQLPPPLELPLDRPRAAIKTFRGASLCRQINADLYRTIKKAGARQNCTLFVTLLAGFQALIGRLAGQDEVVVGVPTAGQSLLENQALAGHCVNLLALRGRWTPDTTVSEHLAATSKCVIDAFEHQRCTLGTLVRKLDLPRDLTRVPLTQIQFNLERLSSRVQASELQIEATPNAKAFVNFDLFLNLIESEAGLRLDCDYNTDLFDRATIERWLECYEALLGSIAADANRRLVQAAWLPAAMLTQLEGLNQTGVEDPNPPLLQQRIAMQTASHPQAIAVRFGSETLSYAQLDRQANQLARHLLGRVGPSTGSRPPLVGISVSRSASMLISLLAALKAGYAYVPLDPTHPRARHSHILHDAKVAALITDSPEDAELVPASCHVINLHRDAEAIAGCAAGGLNIERTGDDLAYVIYTSGSTGTPKGVEITHGALGNLLSAMAARPGLSQHDVLLAVTTMSFDIAALELYLPLTLGATVIIASAEDIADGHKLQDLIRHFGVTVMQATPSGWRLLLEAGFRPEGGFRMLSGGEALPRELANQLLAGGAELWNMYGPTETTVWSSCARISADDKPIGVGRPIDNTQFYVLDRHDQRVPPGVPGQLHIGGYGVARGYHGRAALTAERFVANPFASGRMYRTGDRARITADGDVQLLGRIDHQVKLRGFRIELGEIETALLGQPGISAAAVALREDVPGHPALTAYFVEIPDQAQTAMALKSRLAEQLPEYMLPSTWVKLDVLPFLPNGKLDRAALPAPLRSVDIADNITEPRTPLEVGLADIWKEVLRLERLGTEDDVFALGADSIQLFQITARAKRKGIPLTARQLIRHRTIAALAKALDRSADPVNAAINGQPRFDEMQWSSASADTA